MDFDKNKSKIAITIPRFALRKRHNEWFEGKYFEPYIVSMAVDAKGGQNPAIAFNLMPFPKVAVGGCVTMPWRRAPRVRTRKSRRIRCSFRTHHGSRP